MVLPNENSVEMADISNQDIKARKSDDNLISDNKLKSMTPNNLDLKRLSQYNSSARNFIEATAAGKVDEMRSLTGDDQYLPEDIQVEQEEPKEVHFYPTMNQTTP